LPSTPAFATTALTALVASIFAATTAFTAFTAFTAVSSTLTTSAFASTLPATAFSSALPATAHGWSVRSLRDVSYPGLIPAPYDSLASGLLRSNVSPIALARLDAFEGHDYLRQLIAITLPDGSTSSAWAWIVSPAAMHLVLPDPWDADLFARDSLTDFLRNATGDPP
jgi:gamma-glutamylcyclotransferase (GGCT)/AIG2-like uncharacterized protein YtfP